MQTELQKNNGLEENGMQIGAVTVNASGMAAGTGIQGKSPLGTDGAQTGKSGFGPECRVTISKEGRNRSRQQQEVQAEKSVQSTRLERKLISAQEEAEQSKSIKDGYREQLAEIEQKISTLNSSYNKIKDKDETIGKQQEVLRAMRNLKEFQDEQSQRLAKEARQMAMQSAGYQDEIDENNRDLLTLLKTMEEAQKAEEEREGGEAAERSDDSGSSAPGTINSVSDVIKNSAAHYMMSSAGREWGVQEAIAGLSDLGHYRLKLADTVTQNVLNEVKNIRTAMDDELYTDEQIEDMMKLLVDGTTKPGIADEFRRRGWKTGMQLIYDDVEYSRGWGLQNLQDAQEVKILHLGDNPGRNAQETGKSMMLSAVDAALGEARQGSLDRASQELEDEVKKLIDERNDADSIRQDREEDEEDQEKKAEKKEEQTEMKEKLLQAEEKSS